MKFFYFFLPACILSFFRFLNLSDASEAYQFVEHFKNIELKRQVNDRECNSNI